MANLGGPFTCAKGSKLDKAIRQIEQGATTLDISGQDWTGDELKEIARKMTDSKVDTVIAIGSKTGYEGIAALSERVAYGTIKRFNLKDADISDEGISAMGALALAEAMTRRSSRLEVLNLANTNGVFGAGVMAIAQSQNINPTLRFLSLEGQSVKDEGDAHSAVYPGRAPKKACTDLLVLNPVLRELDLTDCNLVLEGSTIAAVLKKHNSILERLDMKHHHISTPQGPDAFVPDEMDSIRESLQRNASLRQKREAAAKLGR